jgi:[ribosomal protein S18]-alanine N-acetyltransferase
MKRRQGSCTEEQGAFLTIHLTKERLRAKGIGTVLKSQSMPDTCFVIRRMGYEDIPQVAQIDREAFPGEWVFRSQAAYKQDLDNPSIRYLVVCKIGPLSASDGQPTPKPAWFKRLFSHRFPVSAAEEIVGFSGFWMMMKEAHIIAIGVRDEYRRLGLGEGLLIASIELAQRLNANLVTLEVRASNIIAQELYRKYGFQTVGRRAKYYSSDGEDAIIMTTDNITSALFQASFQKSRKEHAQRHPELSPWVR